MKSEKHQKVSEALLELLLEKGMAGLNISRLSQKAKVSRAWIYEYMGKDRETLARVAAESCSAFFVRSHISVELQSEKEFQQKLFDGSFFLLETCQVKPVFIRLYFKYKGSKGIFGDVIQKYEMSWIKKFSKHISKNFKISLSEAEQRTHALLIMRMGCCFDYVSRPVIKQDLHAATLEMVRMQNWILGN